MNIAPRELKDDGNKSFTQFEFLKDRIRDEHAAKDSTVTDEQLRVEANNRWPAYLQELSDANEESKKVRAAAIEVQKEPFKDVEAADAKVGTLPI